MEYADLQGLIDQDRESRSFFSSLPLGVQLTLQRHDGLIRTQQDLRQYAEFLPGPKLPENTAAADGN